MNNTRSFNPESKFIPVDFQIARLLDFERIESDGGEMSSWDTPLICDEDNKFYGDIDQCFMSSGCHADGIWNLIDQYDEKFTDDDVVIEEVENQSFSEAQILGAKALFMALVHFLGSENNYEKARKRVADIFSQPQLPPEPNNPYDWLK